jgi:hypothetical protein
VRAAPAEDEKEGKSRILSSELGINASSNRTEMKSASPGGMPPGNQVSTPESEGKAAKADAVEPPPDAGKISTSQSGSGIESPPESEGKAAKADAVEPPPDAGKISTSQSGSGIESPPESEGKAAKADTVEPPPDAGKISTSQSGSSIEYIESGLI